MNCNFKSKIYFSALKPEKYFANSGVYFGFDERRGSEEKNEPK